MDKLKSKQTSKDGVAYSGNVTLKWIRKNKVIKTKQIKNTGTLNLFRGIATGLLGYDVSNYIPKYLDIGTSKLATNINDKTLNESILTSRVLLYKYAPEATDDSYIARFYTSIPATSINGQIIYEFGLCGTVDSEDSTLLARIVDTDGVSVDPGTSLFIEWDISISNSGIEQFPEKQN